MKLTDWMTSYIEKIDALNEQFLHSFHLASRLQSSMLYSYEAGGKRLRPLILLATLEMLGAQLEKGLPVAAALELIHTSSLIHDDLPAMDDDDYRRGQLSNHRQFDEATAILAGDALLLHAFELITWADITSDQKVELVKQLAQLSGANGMVGGQQLDIENDRTKKRLSLEEVETIDANKTSRLLEFALVAAGIIAGCGEEECLQLKAVGHHIGLAFQIKDDLLDQLGESEKLGKQTSSDEKNNKLTYIDLLGIEGAEDRLHYHYEQALNYLASFNGPSDYLKALFQIIIERDH